MKTDLKKFQFCPLCYFGINSVGMLPRYQIDTEFGQISILILKVVGIGNRDVRIGPKLAINLTNPALFEISMHFLCVKSSDHRWFGTSMIINLLIIFQTELHRQKNLKKKQEKIQHISFTIKRYTM